MTKLWQALAAVLAVAAASGAVMMAQTVPGSDDPRCDLICNAENGCTTPTLLDTCDASCDAAVRDTSGPCGSCLLDNVCATSCNFRQSDASACNTLCN